ncbi:MAG: apolipoprotein N-acyltransferase [Magnetococcales bacterium]|nr:apolipoprotein N-acyltransferase [Magnetococcales bacterium]
MSESLSPTPPRFLGLPLHGSGPGWRLGAAFVAGSLAVRGLPPHQEIPGLVVAFAALLLLIQGVGWRLAAACGFLFGLAYFSFGCSWLLTSLHGYGLLPLPVALAMLIGLGAVLALYPALFAGLLARLQPPPSALPLLVPALWVLSEELRAVLFTGFPWNQVGYAWHDLPWVVQSADLGGVGLLSGLTLFLAACLTLLVWPDRRAFPLRQRVIWGLTGVLLLGALAGYGRWRLADLEEKLSRQTFGKPVMTALVQGAIPQHDKWNSEFGGDHFRLHLELTKSLKPPVDLTIWGETALAFQPEYYPSRLDQLDEMARWLKGGLLTGAPMVQYVNRKPYAVYNSLLLFTGTPGDTPRYDKHHLVPFGEYIPLRRWAFGDFKKFTHGTKDFSPGPGPRVVSWAGGNLGPLICYEAIFPEEVRHLALQGAQFLVHVTNDAWFGPSAKEQHLAMARLRAIENRLSLARVANTGISVVFDPLGRVILELPQEVRLARQVSMPIGPGHSLFVTMPEWGRLLFWSLLGVLGLLQVWRGRKRGSIASRS